MRNIKIGFVTLVVALCLLWLSAEGFPTADYAQYMTWRGLLYWSGILAMGAMSVSIILAMRLKFLEPWLGGLDKMYRLHKWLGIQQAAGRPIGFAQMARHHGPGGFHNPLVCQTSADVVCVS